ncbi:DNA dC-_dU-editing enzyme APOBEC-3F-like isoform X2 [Talpa occidentalis]|uniref:DNA dC->dU-editing enzyme APOBEC-3F-like isoform X2 n=1 Tax=Talpa occidentalis TaxID=50954 RepID=UPI0023F74487|nr:DNA dC->dU-editing enzyme APOBEC-3F-like isoform X2 [Talpa occidentalis]
MSSIRVPEGYDIYQRPFHFHFKNLLRAYGRNRTFICYEVERQDGGSFVSVASGVFTNQFCHRHAELLLLSWLRQLLSPREHYHVTWFMSWSPCAGCARAVADFLQEHRTTVQLSVFAARLYYHWDPKFREGLRRLSHLGAQVDIMSFQHFRYCWDNFVDNQGTPFRPWKELQRNYRSLVTILKDILRVPEGYYIYRPTFYFHFKNLLRAYGRNRTFICYEVKKSFRGYFFHVASGVFTNQFEPGPQIHPELLLLSWLEQLLSPREHYHVTWFMSWSPCAGCARAVADFLQKHHTVQLSVFAARLYYHWEPEYREGLRRLGAQVDIMSFEDFRYCWDNFVDNQGTPFRPWKELQRNYRSLVTILKDILRT